MGLIIQHQSNNHEELWSDMYLLMEERYSYEWSILSNKIDSDKDSLSNCQFTVNMKKHQNLSNTLSHQIHRDNILINNFFSKINLQKRWKETYLLKEIYLFRDLRSYQLITTYEAYFNPINKL